MIKANFLNQTTNLVKKNFKFLIIIFLVIFTFFCLFLFYKNIQEKNNIRIAEQYIQASLLIKQNKKEESKILLEGIIDEKHKFYSALSLYLMIDNNLEKDSLKIISYFDKILKIKSIDKENSNLIRVKKAIFLFSEDNEELILKTLNPLINSDSVWRSTAINLISNYFLFKDQKKKANEYIQLLKNKKNK